MKKNTTTHGYPHKTSIVSQPEPDNRIQIFFTRFGRGAHSNQYVRSKGMNTYSRPIVSRNGY